MMRLRCGGGANVGHFHGSLAFTATCGPTRICRTDDARSARSSAHAPLRRAFVRVCSTSALAPVTSASLRSPSAPPRERYFVGRRCHSRRSLLGSRAIGSLVNGLMPVRARLGSGSNMRSQIFTPLSQSDSQARRLECVRANASDMFWPTSRAPGSKVRTAPSGDRQSMHERIAAPHSQKKRQIVCWP